MRSRVFDENLQNEFKGGLFEFLVASTIAREHAVEASFLDSISTDLFSQLRHYETELRNQFPERVRQLQAMSVRVGENLKLIGVRRVLLIGHSSLYGEGDILVETEEAMIPISLKLNKWRAFVNTKSGGISSFLETYFHAPQEQIELNRIVHESFQRMAFSLYDHVGLLGDEGPVSFQTWRSEGHPELPGELPEDQREIVFRFYRDVTASLNASLERAYRVNPEQFRADLLPLCGHSVENLLQVLCFHDDHECRDVRVIRRDDIVENLRSIDSGNVEMKTPLFDIQIRVKPMNVFTVPSLKVNCALKFA